MASKYDLEDWITECLTARGGRASLLNICWWIWKEREKDLRGSGDLFVTWQYDVRWAATRLRKTGKLRQAHESPRGIWELA